MLLLEPFSFFVASIISISYLPFDFCWNKHPLFLLPSPWSFAGASVFFATTVLQLCWNQRTFLFVILAMASVPVVRVDDERRGRLGMRGGTACCTVQGKWEWAAAMVLFSWFFSFICGGEDVKKTR